MWAVVVAAPVAVLEPETTEGDAVALAVPVRHRERADTFRQTEEAVRVQQKPPVDELVVLSAARRPQHYVRFWLFVGEGRGGGAVGQAAYHDH